MDVVGSAALGRLGVEAGAQQRDGAACRCMISQDSLTLPHNPYLGPLRAASAAPGANHSIAPDEGGQAAAWQVRAQAECAGHCFRAAAAACLGSSRQMWRLDWNEA